MLLVVPQFVVWTFALAWLVQDRDWSPAAAGAVVALAQVVGAFSRLGVGQLSDVVGGRMRPLRWVTWAAIASMLALGATAGLDWGVAVLLMVVATAVTVADNGLAFTAVAERAGPFWSGRALGIQNTAQFLGASLVPPAGRPRRERIELPGRVRGRRDLSPAGGAAGAGARGTGPDLSVRGRAHFTRHAPTCVKGCDLLRARS